MIRRPFGVEYFNPRDREEVSPEGFARYKLDRNIGSVNDSYIKAFGLGNDPINTAVRYARRFGNLAFFEAGNGAGSTQLTLRDAVQRAAGIDEKAITTRGFNRHNYSAESRSSRTREFWAHPNEYDKYFVGDITQPLKGLCKIAGVDLTRSADMVLAHETVKYWGDDKDTMRGLRNLGRLARAGGTIFFNVDADKSSKPSSPTIKAIEEWEDMGWKVDLETITAPTHEGPWLKQNFFRVQLPEIGPTLEPVPPLDRGTFWKDDDELPELDLIWGQMEAIATAEEARSLSRQHRVRIEVGDQEERSIKVWESPAEEAAADRIKNMESRRMRGGKSL